MRLKIITTLQRRPGEDVPETALRMEIEMKWRIKIGDLEFEEALFALEEAKLIQRGQYPVTGDRTLKLITK